MNSKGDMNSFITGILLLLVSTITLYVVLVVWQPTTTMMLFPLLSNAAAFPYGSTAILLMNVVPLIAVLLLVVAFIAHARGEGRPPTGYYG